MVAFSLPGELVWSYVMETLHYPHIGLSIAKPQSWHHKSVLAIKENRKEIRLSDREFWAEVQNESTAPLVYMNKHIETVSSVNPTAQVIFRPLGQMQDLKPMEIMEAIIAPTKSALKFAVVHAAQESLLSGHRAVHTVVEFTVRNDAGESFPTRSRMWLVPRGAFLFMIGCAGPQAGPDVCEDEFKLILASVTIAP